MDLHAQRPGGADDRRLRKPHRQLRLSLPPGGRRHSGQPHHSAGHFLVQIGSEPSRTNVFGYVRDSGGAAISGATVRLEPCGQTATTDANGYFLINSVYEGLYSLTAAKAGFQPSSRSVQSAPGVMPLSVTLSP
ncbi:MAG: carboxypeptidase-like regulatory domain-containing protein [Myxococcales bacterium]